MPTNSLIDVLILEVDKGIRSILPPKNRIPEKPSPARTIEEASLSTNERRHVAGLMRVNHSGEVCAQALYQGQGLTANLHHIKHQMQEAAREETTHLAWCEERLQELGAKPSVFNAIWYSLSFLMGVFAGFAGDKISLGFVAETEQQVSQHLQKHMMALPPQDKKTKAILQQMEIDERHHREVAIEAGGIRLPFFIQQLMALGSKLMTKSSYYG